MDAKKLTLFISGLANNIAENVTQKELEMLAVIFTQLGDTLTTLALFK